MMSGRTKLIIVLLVIIFSLTVTNTYAETFDLMSSMQTENDIVYNHLIQIDIVDNKLNIIEYLYFSNFGTKEYRGILKTWVPDGAEDVKISKILNGTKFDSISIKQDGNIISWQDIIDTRPRDAYTDTYNSGKYKIEYKFKPKESLNKITFSKIFIYPPSITKIPNKITLYITRKLGDNISIIDENGNNISSFGNPWTYDNLIFYNFDVPEFKEINVNFNYIGRLDISMEVMSLSDNPINEIYVGSLIYYNITVHNPNKYQISRNLNISISDSDGEILHSYLCYTEILSTNQSTNCIPYLDDKKQSYIYISPLKADTYILKVTNDGIPIIFHENIIGGVKPLDIYYLNAIKYPFPVASQYEKRLKERNEKQFNQSMELNNNMLKLTKKLERYTLIILIATIITVLATAFTLLMQLSKENKLK